MKNREDYVCPDCGLPIVAVKPLDCKNEEHPLPIITALLGKPMGVPPNAPIFFEGVVPQEKVDEATRIMKDIWDSIDRSLLSDDLLDRLYKFMVNNRRIIYLEAEDAKRITCPLPPEPGYE